MSATSHSYNLRLQPIATMIVLMMLTAVVVVQAQITSSCTCNTPATKALLLELRAATGGRYWTGDPWTADNLCTWEGVKLCNGTNVSVIDIRSRNLSGTLPGSILAKFPQMSNFTVSNNSLVGTIPLELTAWTYVRIVSLDANRLSGTLPNEFGVAWSAEMRQLDVSSNSLSGTLPDSYKLWGSTMWVFDVSENRFTGTLPESYSAWTNLRRFNVFSNTLTGTLPASYSAWGGANSSFTYFRVYSNQLNGALPASYSNWSASMSQFYVQNNQFTGTLPASYALLTNIAQFFVQGNQLTGILPKEYGAGWNTSLRNFNVESNSLSGSLPPEYSTWRSATRITVRANAFIGVLPASYSDWGSTLVEFYANENSLEGSIPNEYKRFTKLEAFVVQQNRLTGTLSPDFSSWTKLTRFSCERNGMTGTVPESYKAWTSLQQFSVSDNFFTGTLSPLFSAWTPLVMFNAYNNSLTGSFPSEYSAWTLLKRISISNNMFSGTMPATFASWTSLIEHSFGYNRFSGTLPREYGTGWGRGGRGEGGGGTNVLETVSFAYNRLEGTLPPEYSSWSSLQFIALAGNSFSGTLPEEYGTGGWGAASMLSFLVRNNQLSGTIPASYQSWRNLIEFDVELNRLEGTLPEFIPTSWRKITHLFFGTNRFTGTIPASYASLPALSVLHMGCNLLSESLPEQFGTQVSLKEFIISGNYNISGSLPALWGSAGVLQLSILLIQNTSLSGRVPSTWSVQYPMLSGLITACGTGLCDGSSVPISPFILPGCINDNAVCNMYNMSYAMSQSVIFPLTSLPPCTAPPPLPPAVGTQTPAPAPPSQVNHTVVPQGVYSLNPPQVAVVAVSAPLGSLAALAASTSAGLGIVRAGAAIRLVSCGGGVDQNELAVLAGGHLGAFLGVFALLFAVVAYRRHQLGLLKWSHAAESLRLPGRAWGVVSGVVPALIEFGLGLTFTTNDGPVASTSADGSNDAATTNTNEASLVALGVISSLCGLGTCAWLWSVVTYRFSYGAAWQTDEHFENRNPKSRRYDAMLRDENASVLEIVHSLMNEYNFQRNSGEWVDAPQHHHHHHPDGSNDRKTSPSSFVATHGAVFEDYCEGRVWFVVWESALAVAVSVLSAVAGAVTGACNALQIVGAVLQMAGLVMLVVARPHREARALCVGVAMEVLGFVGGLCLLVSAAAFPDDDSNSWSTAASDVLQAQFYVGAALVVIDGLYSRRIINALRSFFNAEQNKRQQPELSLPTHSWVHGVELRHRQLRDLIATICAQQRKQKRQGNIDQEQQY